MCLSWIRSTIKTGHVRLINGKTILKKSKQEISDRNELICKQGSKEGFVLKLFIKISYRKLFSKQFSNYKFKNKKPSLINILAFLPRSRMFRLKSWFRQELSPCNINGRTYKGTEFNIYTFHPVNSITGLLADFIMRDEN